MCLTSKKGLTERFQVKPYWKLRFIRYPINLLRNHSGNLLKSLPSVNTLNNKHPTGSRNLGKKVYLEYIFYILKTFLNKTELLRMIIWIRALNAQ